MATPVGALTDQETAIGSHYRHRRDCFADEAATFARWRYWLVAGRTVAVLLCAVLLLSAVSAAGSPGAGIVPGLLLILVWSGSNLAIERVLARLRYAECLRDINDESLARMQRIWDRIPLLAPDIPDRAGGLGDDLDVFGRASLFHLLCQAHSAWGVATLCDWLLQPASPDELQQRQGAVAAMAGDLELRQELAAKGRLLAAGPAGPSAFAAWAACDSPVAYQKLLVWRDVYPLVLAALAIPFALGWMSPTLFGCLVAALLLVNLILSAVVCGPLHDVLRRLGGRGEALYQYKSLFAVMSRSVGKFPGLARILEARPGTLAEATAALQSLHRILHFARLLRLPAIWVPVQLLTLWDFHIHRGLERWRRCYGTSVRVWLQALGRLEAISSLAALAHDNPTWCYPKIGGSPSDNLVAVGIAHPLLPATVRIANDVTLGPRGRVLFVTGSNMTGKSTFLRAIGLNVLLGQAGAPVCAQQFQAPRVALATTVRVRDSLERGISLYMAELLRLKQVVSQARTLKDSEDVAVLFLLDEILLGTNTAERHIAARAVIQELLRLKAFGAVSTHDLDLPTDPLLAEACDNKHFRETLVNQNGFTRLAFDYLLRPGIAQSTNAIRLLEAVGLGCPETGTGSEPVR